jgi:hypothetical protein
MKVFGLVLVVAAVVLTGGQAYSQEPPVITLRRTPCYGICPAYTLEIFADGRVIYHGERFVSITGTREQEISAAAVSSLVDGFAGIHYFDLKDEYETKQYPDGTIEAITDQPTTYTSVRVGILVKSIRDYAFAPEELSEMEWEVDRLVNTHQWIHGDDDLKDGVLVRSDVYTRIKPGMTLLMQAAAKGDQEAIRREYRKGADVNARDETGWTALMLAAEGCQEGAVRQLLDWGAKVGATDHHGDDALIGAAAAFCYTPEDRNSQKNILELLIARGANANIQDDAGVSPLMLLSKYGNVEAARSLLGRGAKMDVKDRAGKMAIDYALEAREKSRDGNFADESDEFIELLEKSNRKK